MRTSRLLIALLDKIEHKYNPLEPPVKTGRSCFVSMGNPDLPISCGGKLSNQATCNACQDWLFATPVTQTRDLDVDYSNSGSKYTALSGCAA